MKRSTITLPDDLQAELDVYLAAQGPASSLNRLVEAALRRYLREQRLEARQFQPAAVPLRITPARRGSGIADTSLEHDRCLTEKP
jgi:metal-responsive CopG/Arc/MetJ family transcriptional regulator